MAGTTDEASPLLQNGHIQNAANTDSSTGKDVIIIDFDTNDDPENPITWPQTYKWCLVALLAFMSFTVYAYSPFPSCSAEPLTSPKNLHLHISRSCRQRYCHRIESRVLRQVCFGPTGNHLGTGRSFWSPSYRTLL